MDGQNANNTDQVRRSGEKPLFANGTAVSRRVVTLVVAGIALLVAAAIGVRSLLAPADVPAATPDLPLVTVRAPGTSEIARTVNFSGTIAARNDLPIGVDGDGGRISEVLVDAGDRVRKGQLLARLDTATMRPQVASLAAALEQARAEANLADAEYRRAEGVAASGALSKEETERRRAAALTAGAKVKVAEAQLREAQARLARTEVRAPTSGIVLTRNAEIGQIASPGSAELFRLARGGLIELKGDVSEQDLPQLRVGQQATVRLAGVAEPFAGVVRLVGAVVDPATRLGEVRIALGESALLRPGAFAQGEVTLERSRLPIVPQTAVLSDGDVTYVLIADATNRVQRRVVKVSGVTPAGVMVASGLDGTERVVVTAGAFLREGEQIAVASDPAAAAPGKPVPRG